MLGGSGYIIGPQQAFGVEFRRSDIERMRPTDGEWISAKEALASLTSLKMNYVDALVAICTRAHAGMIRAKAKRYIVEGRAFDDEEIPKAFWWAKGGEALSQIWETGDFESNLPRQR
jgi:hypothetical protein